MRLVLGFEPGKFAILGDEPDRPPERASLFTTTEPGRFAHGAERHLPKR